MAKWKKTFEELPDCEVGEHVVCLCKFRDGSPDPDAMNADLPFDFHVVVLICGNFGWIDASDGDIDISDSEWWILEKDLVKDAIGESVE